MHLHIFLLLQKRECVMASEMFSDVKISNQMIGDDGFHGIMVLLLFPVQ
jgi:hypothetical protein